MKIKVLIALAILLAMLTGVIFAIHKQEQKRAQLRIEKRIENEKRVAIEKKREQEQIHAEEEEERKKLAMEAERVRAAKEQEDEQVRLAKKLAQEKMESDEQLLAEKPVSLSSNNFVTLSCAVGDFFHFNSDGFIIKTEQGIQPRKSWDNLTEQDAKILLRTPKVFEMVTSFGFKNVKEIPIGSAKGRLESERQMEKIWQKGGTLKEKLVQRITILDICKTYNETLRNYIALAVSSQSYDAAAVREGERAEQSAQNGLYALSPRARMEYQNGTIGGSSSDILRQLAVTQMMSPNYKKADQLSRLSRVNLAGAKSSANKLNEYLGKLYQMGFELPGSGSFPTIYPMNLKREVAIELNTEK